MLIDILFPNELQLCIDGVEMENESISICVRSTNEKDACPNCQTISKRVHSLYQREPADLPLAGYTIRLDMTVHRFFCDNSNCKAKTFTERMPSFIQHYARQTNRLTNMQQAVAFEAGGEGGKRVLTALDMPVSSDTLLRLIHNAPEPEMATPKALGVDDWAKRKGQSYGTILVDLETHQPVDLLPERSAELLAEWLKGHPGVEVISRDRGQEYIKGATDGAPDAIQVADRWHLLVNLRSAMERFLEGKRACLKAAADESRQTDTEDRESSVLPVDQPLETKESTTMIEEQPDAKLTKADKRKLAVQEKRQERYKAVKELHEQGLYTSEISQRLNMDRKTINRYIKADECPMYSKRARSSKLDPYKEYITQRWQSGCYSATEILHEIRQMGYKGARSIMMDWVSKTFKASHKASNPYSSSKTIVHWSARRGSWLLVKRKDELTEEEKQALFRMKQADGKVAEAYDLANVLHI